MNHKMELGVCKMFRGCLNRGLKGHRIYLTDRKQVTFINPVVSEKGVKRVDCTGK